MPNFKVIGLDRADVCVLSADCTGALAGAIGCEEDWITFCDCGGVGSVICCGKTAKETVYVGVEWFCRGKEVQDVVAKIITKSVRGIHKANGIQNSTVDVVFWDIEKHDFFEDGEHF